MHCTNAEQTAVDGGPAAIKSLPARCRSAKHFFPRQHHFQRQSWVTNQFRKCHKMCEDFLDTSASRRFALPFDLTIGIQPKQLPLLSNRVNQQHLMIGEQSGELAAY